MVIGISVSISNSPASAPYVPPVETSYLLNEDSLQEPDFLQGLLSFFITSADNRILFEDGLNIDLQP